MGAGDPLDAAAPPTSAGRRSPWSTPASRRGLDDFQGYLDDQSADCTTGRGRAPISNPMAVNDTFGHGTRVATIAAAPANGKGTVGVSPDSQLIVVKFTTADSNFNPVCAFNYLAGIARSGQLLVVNLSFTIGQPTPGAQHALQALIRAGALVVAASGNTSAPSSGRRASRTCSRSDAATATPRTRRAARGSTSLPPVPT